MKTNTQEGDAGESHSVEERKGLVTCRAGLERVVAEELRDLDVEVTRIGTRAVFIRTDLTGIYRANLGLRSALNVLVPIRSFHARNYDMLYFQSRKTFWHKMFAVDRNLRIDVNGGSSQLRNTEYVVHRIKDGIVDTFRKLCSGQRPSIDKRNPDVHIVAHLDGPRVTLCMDTSGQPLFKRGYREEHGEAPLKEDLAAGILALGGWRGDKPLCDPMCGSGTLLYEAWMRAAGLAPNLQRKFGFTSLYEYDSRAHTTAMTQLRSRQNPPSSELRMLGVESDPGSFRVSEKIQREYFPEAPLTLRQGDFRDLGTLPPETFVVCNPPYGKRIGRDADLPKLYRDLGNFLRIPDGFRRAAIFTAYPDAVEALGIPPRKTISLYNGAIPCQLLCYG